VSLQIKLSIQLAHGDGLGVDDERLHWREREPIRCQLAFDRRQRVTEDLIALPTNHHKPLNFPTAGKQALPMDKKTIKYPTVV
jgi:hypothetical protein